MNQYVPAIRVAEILSTAEEVVHTCGHTNHTFMNKQGAVCLAGAVAAAVVDPSLSLPVLERGAAIGSTVTFLNPEYVAALATLAKVLPTTCCGANYADTPGANVFHYNDAHCDGGDTALTVLREAREKLEAEL